MLISTDSCRYSHLRSLYALLRPTLRTFLSNLHSSTPDRWWRGFMVEAQDFAVLVAFEEEFDVQDLLFIAVTIAFFGVSIGYVHFCDRMK